MWRRIWSLSAVRFAARAAVSRASCAASSVFCAAFMAAAFSFPALRHLSRSCSLFASFSTRASRSSRSASSRSFAAASAFSRSRLPAPPSSMSFSSTAMACCCSVSCVWSVAASASSVSAVFLASETSCFSASSFLRSSSMRSSAAAASFFPFATVSVRRPMSPAARTSSCVMAFLRAARRSRTDALFSVRSRSVASSAVTLSTCFWSAAPFSPSFCISCSMATMAACVRSFSASAVRAAVSAAVFSVSAPCRSVSACVRFSVRLSCCWLRLVRRHFLYVPSSS